MYEQVDRLREMGPATGPNLRRTVPAGGRTG
jgi:hypothetical protein